MKTIFKGLSVFLIIWGVFYLLTSFINMSFDAAAWPLLHRSGLAVFGTFIAMIVAVMVVCYEIEEL